MIVEQTVTWLEMTSRRAAAGSAALGAVGLEPVDRSRVPLLRETTNRVGRPARLDQPVRVGGAVGRAPGQARGAGLLARVGGEPAGLIELRPGPAARSRSPCSGWCRSWLRRGSAGTCSPGRSGWPGRPGIPRPPTRRVWLHTASTDHPGALPNYLGRGFRVVHSEVRRRRVPAGGRLTRSLSGRSALEQGSEAGQPAVRAGAVGWAGGGVGRDRPAVQERLELGGGGEVRLSWGGGEAGTARRWGPSILLRKVM